MKYIKRIYEFLMAEPATKPATPTRPATPSTPTRPERPGPRTVPGPGEKEKPMAVVTDILDQFFGELEKVKDTKEGLKMIKKLHSKYVKKD